MMLCFYTSIVMGFLNLILQKLVILAHFGISLLNALNYKTNSETHNHGSILLPSSLYRICPGEKRQEASFKADV